MKYDFTSLMNRSGHDSIAVDQIPIPGAEVKEGFSRIPMWVADMNFPSLPTIQEAIHARVNEPHFGYFNLPDAYFDSIIRWQKERNGVEDLPREAIGYENGVLGCVASAAAAFTSPGESILLHSPTYIGFTGVLENCGRNIVLSDLFRMRRRMAYGLRRYGPQVKRTQHSFRDFLLSAQPDRPCLGARGN